MAAGVASAGPHHDRPHSQAASFSVLTPLLRSYRGPGATFMLVRHLVRHRHQSDARRAAEMGPHVRCRGSATADNTVSGAHVPDGTEKPPAHRNHKRPEDRYLPAMSWGGVAFFPDHETARPTQPFHPHKATRPPFHPLSSNPTPPSLYRPFLAPLPCPHPIPEEHTAIPPSPLTPSPEWVPGSCISPTGDDNYLAPPHLGPRLLFFPPQPTSRQSINPTKSTRRICSFTTNRNHSS